MCVTKCHVGLVSHDVPWTEFDRTTHVQKCHICGQAGDKRNMRALLSSCGQEHGNPELKAVKLSCVKVSYKLILIMITCTGCSWFVNYRFVDSQFVEFCTSITYSQPQTV